MSLDPAKQREFAVDVVRTLRGHGFEAYWAGGCVRDRLLGQPPKDYDVATTARPEQIREVFTRRRTVPVGAQFGVITVVGPKPAGQVEVATFREDVTYSDGRHPDAVEFSTPEADAHRRDFTINGLFYDPLEDRVIDYVGGVDDLGRGVVRAIGEPRARFRGRQAAAAAGGAVYGHVRLCARHRHARSDRSHGRRDRRGERRADRRGDAAHARACAAARRPSICCAMWDLLTANPAGTGAGQRSRTW